MARVRSAVALIMAGKLYDLLLQFSTPIVLVRLLSVDDFSSYRMLWLLTGAIVLLAPLGLPASLQYFIPRQTIDIRRSLLGQTLILTAVSSLVCVLIMLTLLPLLPGHITNLVSSREAMIALFIFLWVFTLILDVLPLAHEQYASQAYLTIFSATVRVICVISSAYFARDIDCIIVAMLAISIIRLLTLIYYLYRKFPPRFFPIERNLLERQVRYSAPFGIAAALYGFRKQGEQWVVSALFSKAQFAAFSLAGMIVLPLDLIRTSISSVLLPKLNANHAKGQFRTLHDLNMRGNLAGSAFIFPVISYLFAFAPEIVHLLFTQSYSDAAPAMRIFLLQAAISIDVGSLMTVYGLGRFSVSYNAAMLPLTIIASYLASLILGLSGAATGSLFASLAGMVIVLLRISEVSNIPVKKLQFWVDISILALVSAGCAALARYMNLTLGHNSVGFSLFFGVIVTFVTYGCMLFLIAMSRRSNIRNLWKGASDA